jgi:nucleotide-binding universal stress UspA family protein
MLESGSLAETHSAALLTARSSTAAVTGPIREGWPARILVCADDKPPASDALAAAHSIAARSGAAVELLAVFSPSVSLPNAASRRGSAQCEGPDRPQAAQLVNSVRRQQRERLGGRVAWPVQLEVGDPVKVILQYAADSGAELVVMGIGDADPRVRQRGGGTPAIASNHLPVPLLAAAPTWKGVPRDVVLYLDRDVPHLPTVRAALHCMDSRGVLWVMMHGGGRRASDGGGVRHDQPTMSRVLHLVRAEAAAVSRDVAVRAVYRTGDPVQALLQLANESGAGLIVTPVYGAPGVVRSFLPNVADRLLLTASCSVLAIPDWAG